MFHISRWAAAPPPLPLITNVPGCACRYCSVSYHRRKGLKRWFTYEAAGLVVSPFIKHPLTLSLYWLCSLHAPKALSSASSISSSTLHFRAPRGHWGCSTFEARFDARLTPALKLARNSITPPPHPNPTHPLKRHFVLRPSDGSVSGEGWGLNIHIWGGGNASGPLRRGIFHISRCDVKLNFKQNTMSSVLTTWPWDRLVGGVGGR